MKLSKYGVIGQTLYWVKKYLSNRTQRTLANNMLSDIALVKCGIPQGSVLGPLLFLIYINDASNTCTECRIRLYADDRSSIRQVTTTTLMRFLEHYKMD